MNKRVKKKKEVKHDGTEDLKIKKVANQNNVQTIIAIMLILLFGLTLFTTLVYVGKFYHNKYNDNNNQETIEIIKDDTKIVISNNGSINKTLSTSDNNKSKEIILENIDTIEIESHDYNNILKKYFDIRYNITKNDFTKNVLGTNDSDVIVRFAFSYDKKEWFYLNNAVTINGSNINSLIGSSYDLAGVIGNVKVLTNYELSTNPTIIKYKEENLGKTIQAEFKVNYKDLSE